MMLPGLNDVSLKRDYVNAWLGYQHIPSPASGAFFETENLSAALCPVLGPRAARTRVHTLTDAGGLAAKSELAWVENGKLYYAGKPVADVTNGKKQFVGMGAWMLIWPDKIMYNTADGTVEGLEAEFTSQGTVGFSLCQVSGADYAYYAGPDEPNTSEYLYWLDTSGETPVLKLWDASTRGWTNISTTYVKIAAEGIGTLFSDNDVVTIGGCTNEELNGDYRLYRVQPDYVVISSLVREAFEQTSDSGALSLKRAVPDMEYMTECNNRVWGCNSEKNEIYACALGDAKNWFKYSGAVNDSYAVSVGSDGNFTGAVSHLGYVLFFKEDCIHKIYGTAPSDFSLTTTNCRGVQAESEKSLVVVNEILYYKSRYDVCRYDGSLPESVSAALGSTLYKKARAGQQNGRYYISMEGADGVRSLFVYDTATGIWYREDGLNADYFANLRGELYALDAGGGLWNLSGNEVFYDGYDPKREEYVTWSGETGQLDVDSLDAKYVSRIQLRLWLDAKSRFKVECEYDSCGKWITLMDYESGMDRALTIPMRVRRADHIRLRFSGQGAFRLYKMARTISGGSEVR